MPHEQHQGPQEHGEQLPKVTVKGRIGQVYDPEFVARKDGSGDMLVFKFSLAVHPSKDETVWYKVATFDDRAEAMQQRFEGGELRVGQEIAVVGRLREQEYVSRRTGQPGIDRQIFPFEVKPVPPAAPQAPKQ